MRIITRFEWRSCVVTVSDASSRTELLLSRSGRDYTWNWRGYEYATRRDLTSLVCDETELCGPRVCSGIVFLDGYRVACSDRSSFTWKGDGCNRIKIERVSGDQASLVARGYTGINNRYCITKRSLGLLPIVLYLALVESNETS